MRNIAIITAALAMATCSVQAGVFDSNVSEFGSRIDSDSLRQIRVQYQGRIATLDTFARAQMQRIVGAEKLDGVDAPVAYLELYFNGGQYLRAPLLPVKSKSLRDVLAARLTGSSRQVLESEGKLLPALMFDDNLAATMVLSGRARREQFASPDWPGSIVHDLMSLAGDDLYKLQAERLADAFSAFASGQEFCIAPTAGKWICADEILMKNIDGKATELDSLATLAAAWRARDADAVNRCLREILASQSGAISSLRLSASPAGAEIFYNRIATSIAPMVTLAVAAILMLPGAFGVRWARRASLAAIVTAAAMLVFVFIMRWIVSGRGWLLPPLMNMYEGVFASVMLAAAISVIIEFRTGGGFVGFAASLYGVTALLACRWLDAGISAQHGILNSPVMSAHVAVIIVGHGLAAMTVFLSLIYFSTRIYYSLRAAGSLDGDRLSRRVDQCNGLLVSLTVFTLTVGTMLGAYWGDIAWGRWWGWDPKETWALVTILIYLWIVHVRRTIHPDRAAMWTAIGCLAGAGAMLFNWIVVNFFLAGRHSYA